MSQIFRRLPTAAARRLLASSSSSSSAGGSGVVAAHWPEGLLQAHAGKRPTAVSAPLASELLYEVGWQSRHNFLDVRSESLFAAGHVRGAYNVPLEPQTTFVARAEAAVEKIRLDQPAAQHLARASLPRVSEGVVESDDDDGTTAMKMRLVIGGDDTSSLAFTATASLLSAGFTNAVCMDVGFDAWKAMGLPCEGVDVDADEFQDSTF